MSSQDSIDVINELWPPDSDFSDTAKIGREDLLNAMYSEWRTLPSGVLQEMARIQRARDLYNFDNMNRG